MTKSNIEWTDSTWNPTVGCSIVSPGCTNCYAMRMAARLDAMGVEKYRGLTRKTGGRYKWNGRVRLDEPSLDAPLAWREPRMVFVNSMSDLFHEDLCPSVVKRVWSVMAKCPQHTFQILTKRDERMAELSADLDVLPNVWLGVSIENREQLRRIRSLRKTRAVIRFISFEPLLESIGQPDLTGIDWCIVGGESGPKARPMDEDWVSDILVAAGKVETAFHFKQWGGPQKKRHGRTLHGQTFDEFPMQLATSAE